MLVIVMQYNKCKKQKSLATRAKDGQLFEGPTFPVMFDRSK